jgi:hypothetical protein
MDLDYVQRRGLPLYLAILLRTVPSMVRGGGAR